MGKFSLKTILQKLRLKRTSLGGAYIMNPYRDWHRLLLASFLILLLVAAWSAYLFWQVSTGKLSYGESDSPAAAEVEIVEESVFRDTFLFYRDREQIHTELRTASSTFPDPL